MKSSIVVVQKNSQDCNIKKLERGYITEFKVALSGNSRQIVDVGYTSVVLHLTRDG